ncbi:uncharacterized protein LOC132059725 isoform X2 [Lycium ferocissimum]|uniref:uncharacterized protein LOC132059725 isoform X2 n=1 Tax=Lycium ferocissimum TaxID=112874 RepID=UPI0028153E6D|nr:uncharacterized protein LOC132059725 isoform X2 [Lycium ferocissimum]
MTELSDGDTSETKSGGLSSGGFSSGLVVACDPHPAVVSLLIWKLDLYVAASSLIWFYHFAIASAPSLLRFLFLVQILGGYSNIHPCHALVIYNVCNTLANSRTEFFATLIALPQYPHQDN